MENANEYKEDKGGKYFWEDVVATGSKPASCRDCWRLQNLPDIGDEDGGYGFDVARKYSWDKMKMLWPWQGHTILQCNASFFCPSTHLVIMVIRRTTTTMMMTKRGVYQWQLDLFQSPHSLLSPPSPLSSPIPSLSSSSPSKFDLLKPMLTSHKAGVSDVHVNELAILQLSFQSDCNCFEIQISRNQQWFSSLAILVTLSCQSCSYTSRPQAVVELKKSFQKAGSAGNALYV